MKNAGKFLPFLLVIVFLLTGCSKATNVKNFYGKWQNIRSSGAIFVEISAESWKATYENLSSFYAIEGLTWVPFMNKDPVTKNEYPNGYYISGTATQVNNIDDLKMGQQQTFEIFLSKDKTKMLRKNDEGLPDYIFSKIEG
jgi:hypothetical protein